MKKELVGLRGSVQNCFPHVLSCSLHVLRVFAIYMLSVPYLPCLPCASSCLMCLTLPRALCALDTLCELSTLRALRVLKRRITRIAMKRHSETLIYFFLRFRTNRFCFFSFFFFKKKVKPWV